MRGGNEVSNDGVNRDNPTGRGQLSLLPTDVPRFRCGFQLAALFSVRDFARVTESRVAYLF
jgi:hypothetical protein